MQSTYNANDVNRGRVGRRCNALLERLSGWLTEAGEDILATKDSSYMRSWMMKKAGPEVKSLAAVCMEEAANAQVRADERALEEVERELRRRVLVLQQSAEHYKRNWEQAEEEVQELKSRMQQMEQGGEVQSNHHSPCSYR
jgi:hypothetical protein